ncbi:MAG: hypothetical protein LQ343_006618 [Gyalolechia ehrenbergii]|nr:MAG: hypothetical protein LQ343_006618 [Gyalolechia ehrenbergii]
MPSNLVASRDFVNLNFPRHSNNGSKRSRASATHSPAARLSIIEEDGDVPPMPPKAHHRPFHRRWNLGDPPRFSFEDSPPKYSVWDTTGPKGEKLADVRNNKHIARRGGWKRICLIALLTVGIIVALVVGLVFGLRKKNSNHEAPVWPQSIENDTSVSNSTTTFPAGSYTFVTYLDRVQTDCSSQAQDWSCHPDHTFAESPSQAMANFTWVVAESEDGFSISSTGNPFSIVFDSTMLMMLDPGTDDERYQFNTSLDKMTPPSIGVSCFFNDTTLEGHLYTKKPQNYPSSGKTTLSAATASSLASTNDFQPWPYAVEIRQTIGGGQSVPECFRGQANRKGDRVVEGITPRPASSMCSCDYKNFDS